MLFLYNILFTVRGNSILKMEVVGSSETLINTLNITWRINTDMHERD